MSFRKIVTTAIIAAIFFWVPTVIPVRALPASGVGCGVIPTVWLPTDTAFAGTALVVPCPPIHTPIPWVVIIFGGSVVSVILNAAIVSKTQCRELTQQEAWSSAFLPFIGILFNQNNNMCQPRHHHP